MTAASEFTGFVASALVLLTFWMNDMRLLRAVAILSNLAFIVYAALNCLLPVLLLHVLLLPINGYRLLEQRRGGAQASGRRGGAMPDSTNDGSPHLSGRY